MQNSANDGRKGGRLQFKWSQHPYEMTENLGKGCFHLKNLKTGHIMKKAVNSCHLKGYFQLKTDDDIQHPPNSDSKTSSPAKKKKGSYNIMYLSFIIVNSMSGVPSKVVWL